MKRSLTLPTLLLAGTALVGSAKTPVQAFSFEYAQSTEELDYFAAQLQSEVGRCLRAMAAKCPGVTVERAFYPEQEDEKAMNEQAVQYGKPKQNFVCLKYSAPLPGGYELNEDSQCLGFDTHEQANAYAAWISSTWGVEVEQPGMPM